MKIPQDAEYGFKKNEQAAVLEVGYPSYFVPWFPNFATLKYHLKVFKTLQLPSSYPILSNQNEDGSLKI